MCLRVCLRQLYLHTSYGVDLREIYQGTKPTFSCHCTAWDSPGWTFNGGKQVSKESGKQLICEWSWREWTAAFHPAKKLIYTESNPKERKGMCVQSPFRFTPHVYTVLWCHTPVASLWSLNGLPAVKCRWKHICPDCSFLLIPLSSVSDESLLDPGWLWGQS